MQIIDQRFYSEPLVNESDSEQNRCKSSSIVYFITNENHHWLKIISKSQLELWLCLKLDSQQCVVYTELEILVSISQRLSRYLARSPRNNRNGRHICSSPLQQCDKCKSFHFICLLNKYSTFSTICLKHQAQKYTALYGICTEWIMGLSSIASTYKQCTEGKPSYPLEPQKRLRHTHIQRLMWYTIRMDRSTTR